jgi:alanine racemase
MNRTVAELHLDRLDANIRAVRNALRPGAEPIMVVKANAYGHGDTAVVRRGVARGVRWFAVVHLEEALRVREAAPEAEVLLLGVASPADVPALLQHRLTPVVVGREHGRALGAAATGRRLPVHLKVDTGMGRLGIAWQDAVDAGTELARAPGLDVRGICTHFARVAPGPDDPAVRQAERFRSVADALDAPAGRRLFRHASNSRAICCHPAFDFDAGRPGILLYGYEARDPNGRVHTRPVLEWKAEIAQVRRVPAGFPVGYDSTYATPTATVLAILAAGYADGYPRLLSNRAHVLVGGRRCPVAGRVSMNWIAVDLGPGAEARPGDEAVLIGRQGDAEVWADELAALAGTISYEILTGIRPADVRTLGG